MCHVVCVHLRARLCASVRACVFAHMFVVVCARMVCIGLGDVCYVCVFVCVFCVVCVGVRL